MRNWKRPPPFETLGEINRYFDSNKIACLLCGRRFLRLGYHLRNSHRVPPDQYRKQFGLPWSRGLTSRRSRQQSGWTEKRKDAARKLAKKTRFFERAHTFHPRTLSPAVRKAMAANLGRRAQGYGLRFNHAVRKRFLKGWSENKIASDLGVSRSAVHARTSQLIRRRRKGN